MLFSTCEIMVTTWFIDMNHMQMTSFYGGAHLSTCMLSAPTPAQLMGREFLRVGIAAGPPHGPRVVDLWVNGSPNPLCYHKSPLLFSNQTASHAHLSVWTRVQSYTRGAGWGTLLPPPLSSQAKRETTGRYSFRVSPGPFSKNTALSNPHPGR